MRTFLFVFVCVVTVICSKAYSIPARNGMVFYQAPGYYNPLLRNQAYQAMLVHYSQKPYNTHGNGAAGVSAFASGDTIAAGSLLKENKFQHQQRESSYENTDSVSIAEAYPQEPVQPGSPPLFTAGIPQRQAEQSNEVVPEQIPTLNQRLPEEFVPVPPPPPPPPFPSVSGEEQTPIPESTPPATTLAPFPTVTPTNKKKVRVDLDVRGDDDDDDEDDDFVPFLKPKKNKNNGQYPLYSFFPVDFGRTSGGSIAIANSFSTGKAGARSHAIAYGSQSTRHKSGKHSAEA